MDKIQFARKCFCPGSDEIKQSWDSDDGGKVSVAAAVGFLSRVHLSDEKETDDFFIPGAVQPFCHAYLNGERCDELYL